MAIELENAAGEIVTAQRYIKHPTFRPNLVRVWGEAAVTEPVVRSRPTDFFLHDPGSVQGQRGFHALLMKFIGWDLPSVVNYAGNPVLLYPDVIFPFLIVDQQAWVSSGPRKVERYQIREPVRRAAEFLLSLEGPAARKRREELDRRISDLQIDWTSARSVLRGQAGAIGGRVVGVPERPSGSAARATVAQPTDLSDAMLQVSREGEWLPAEDVLRSLQAELTALESSTVTTSQHNEDIDARLREQIDEVREELNDVLAATRLLEQDLTMNEGQLAALDRRIENLTEERNRNRDIATLVRLGSEASAQHIADHNCPTCSQSLDGVEAAELGPTLDVSETIGLINAQISTAAAMRERARVIAEQSSYAYTAMQREIDHLRVRLRSLETDAITADQVPKSGDIARRVSVEIRRDEIRRAIDSFDTRLEYLMQVADDISSARNEFNALPDGLSDADITVLRSVGSLMRKRLRASGFGSYDPELVQVDMDSLQPVRQGFDVDTDASASDVVRIKLAYLDSLRRVGVDRGRHPGLLVLDEPRQQDMELAHYEIILRYLADGNGEQSQVIVTSTTEMAHLRSTLEGSDVSFIELGADRLLGWDPLVGHLDSL
ncbi:hypothetical protein [Actinoplanes rectilineatus]|uniref:hypothetical protein n=1 Tax=Actinoplanes rectilineatus TaxID=113571 RepID=UPI0012F8FCE8|nr:hypothetical protein [Actinoplanes rectilineatus]